MDFTFTENQALAICGAYAVELRITQDKLKLREAEAASLAKDLEVMSRLNAELLKERENVTDDSV